MIIELAKQLGRLLYMKEQLDALDNKVNMMLRTERYS
jgi:hypothetical protein